MKRRRAPQQDDSVLQEIWRIKDELSASYGHDVGRMFEETRKRQETSGHPIANLSPKKKQH